MVIFFFFQAEDGIRDFHVTGVQTCALPICEIIAHPQYGGKGRPRKDASPSGYQWQLVVTLSVNYLQVVQEVLRKACWIVGTNVLELAALSDQQLIATYKDQGGVERGFRFLKDPLFLASSVFVKKP